jgi:hypothetical protein
LADYRVASELLLIPNEKKLSYLHPDGLYQVDLANAPAASGDDENLSVQVIVSAPDIKSAAELTERYSKEFLRLLAFITSTSFGVARKICLIDWTPGIFEREALQYSKHLEEGPIKALSSNLLATAKMLHQWGLSPTLTTALRWYSSGVSSKTMEDQFQLFWFVVEHIAVSTKGPELVADKCQKCRGELYCDNCKEISKHRPFEKQAIEMLLTKTGVPEQLVDDLFYVRNNLMHGEPRENIEASIKSRDANLEFHKIVDIIGKIAWTVILNTFAKPPGQHQPEFLQVSTYVDWKRSMTAHMIIGVGGNPNNPQIEDVRLPTISLIPHAKEE